MRTFVKVPYENGYYKFYLNHLLEEKKISKNHLCRETELDFKTIQRYCTGNLTRLDLSVLARICDLLNCKINEIVEYIPNQK